MNNEFKKISEGNTTRFVLEFTGGGVTGTSSVTTGIAQPMGAVRKRAGNDLISQEGKKSYKMPKRPNNPVAKAHQSIGTGSGEHKDKKNVLPRKEKHKKQPELAEANIDPNAPFNYDAWSKSGKTTTPKHFGPNGAGTELARQNQSNISVQQLATISDEALDNAYHYGRSQPGNTFGWQANLKSAAFAKQMIDAGVTDIEKISDAIHNGWNETAQEFVKDPTQFDDSATMAPEKLQAKIAQRQKLMTQKYDQLPEEEKEKDRVVARAMLQAIKGDQDVAEAKWDPWTGGDFGDDHDMNHLPSDGAEKPGAPSGEQFKAMIQYYGNDMLVKRALMDLYNITHGEDIMGVNNDLKVEATFELRGKTEVRYFRSKKDAYNQARASGARVVSLKPIESDLPKDLITLPVMLGLGDHKKKWMLQFPDERVAQKWEFQHKNAAQIQWPSGHGLAESAPDEKTWMAQIKSKYPNVRWLQAKMPGAPLLAYVDGKEVARFKQGVAESNDEYNDEAGMAHTDLHTIARAAQGLLDTIGDKDNLPEWAQEKIAKVEGMLTAVWDYLESQEEQGIDPQQKDEDAYTARLQAHLEEKLSPKDPEGVWIDDFQKADPNKYHQFKNKSPAKKRQMALAAHRDSQKTK